MSTEQTKRDSSPTSPWRILIVDDHPIVRRGIRAAFADLKRIEIVGEAENAEDAQSSVELLKPDLVMLDIRLKGSRSGVEVATKLREAHPNLKIVVLTNYAQHIRRKLKKTINMYFFLLFLQTIQAIIIMRI